MAVAPVPRYSCPLRQQQANCLLGIVAMALKNIAHEEVSDGYVVADKLAGVQAMRSVPTSALARIKGHSSLIFMDDAELS